MIFVSFFFIFFFMFSKRQGSMFSDLKFSRVNPIYRGFISHRDRAGVVLGYFLYSGEPSIFFFYFHLKIRPDIQVSRGLIFIQCASCNRTYEFSNNTDRGTSAMIGLSENSNNRSLPTAFYISFLSIDLVRLPPPPTLRRWIFVYP